VRFASGLFSALTGARDERQSRQSIADESDSEEEDFIEFFENEIGDPSAQLLCGSNKKFVAINILLIFLFILTDIILIQFGIVDEANLLMTTLVVMYVWAIVIATYVYIRYQQSMNQQRLLS